MKTYTVTASETIWTDRLTYLLTLESDDDVIVLQASRAVTERAAALDAQYGIGAFGYRADGSPVRAHLHTGKDAMPEIGADVLVSVRSTPISSHLSVPAGWPRGEQTKARFRAALRRMCVIAPDVDALIDAYAALCDGPRDPDAVREDKHAPRRMLGFVTIDRATGGTLPRRGVRMVREHPTKDYTYNGTHLFVAPVTWQTGRPSRLSCAAVLADLLDQLAAETPLGARPMIRGGTEPHGARGDVVCPPSERVTNARLVERD